jgi:hypothetical protein
VNWCGSLVTRMDEAGLAKSLDEADEMNEKHKEVKVWP